MCSAPTRTALDPRTTASLFIHIPLCFLVKRRLHLSVHGTTRNLKASQRKALEKIGDQRVRRDMLITPELADRIAAFSADTNRALGLLIDRRGRIQDVVIGDHQRIYLPDIGRVRGGGSRFRGLRLIVTSLRGRGLTNDDLADLSLSQLDAVAAVEVTAEGRGGAVQWAHLVPDNPARELYQKHRAQHANVLPEDFSDFIAELEAEFERAAAETVVTNQERAMLVYVRVQEDFEAESRIKELEALCDTAGVELVETYTQSRQSLDPRYGIGQGALADIELRALQLGADVLVFGQDLSASQLRNITGKTRLRVIDRTQLILDIFAQRAQSAVGKLQVELAQLKYMLPRLSGKGTSMSRLAGGIGGRGPGETKLETDRRRARDRIRDFEKRIETLRQQREIRRKNRQASGIPVIAIVGYTNAGKSTLLNTLTESNVLSEDKLFATLDPTTRRLRVPSAREVVLTDTVGFIRDLPDALKEAFRATLEELDEADLLLHVVDASDPAVERHMESTRALLHDLELDEIPRMLVYNKIDRLDDESREALLYQEDGVAVSATDRESLHVLLEAIDQFLVAMGRVDAIGPPQYPVHDDTAVTAEEDDAHFVTPDEDPAELST